MSPFSAEVFDRFLQQGQWGEKADDNAEPECLKADLIRDIVRRYCDDPGDATAVQDMGLFALAIGVAEWGVADPEELPADPRGRDWKSDADADSGKHLMSYSVGGVGICHADTGTLQRIIREVAEDPTLVPQAHAPALLRLADGNLYTPRSRKRQRGEVTYDQIRAAGLCSGETFDTDLLGEPFRHFPDARVDCTKYKNPNLNASDWRVFRTWMRAALRRRTIQERLVTLWLEKYWNETLARVPKGAGYMEEAFVNVRVRNSNPSAANRALERKGANAAERVQRQLDEYGEVNLDTLKRRCRLMLRPVVLFRHFAGEPPLRGVACPRGAD